MQTCFRQVSYNGICACPQCFTGLSLSPKASLSVAPEKHQNPVQGQHLPMPFTKKEIGIGSEKRTRLKFVSPSRKQKWKDWSFQPKMVCSILPKRKWGLKLFMRWVGKIHRSVAFLYNRYCRMDSAYRKNRGNEKRKLQTKVNTSPMPSYRPPS